MCAQLCLSFSFVCSAVRYTLCSYRRGGLTPANPDCCVAPSVFLWRRSSRSSSVICQWTTVSILLLLHMFTTQPDARVSHGNRKPWNIRGFKAFYYSFCSYARLLKYVICLNELFVHEKKFIKSQSKCFLQNITLYHFILYFKYEVSVNCFDTFFHKLPLIHICRQTHLL